METYNLICIGCPMGCELNVTKENEQFSVTGQNCKIGEKYGVEEVSHPTRMVTSSVVITNGNEKMLSVKTAAPIPKEKMNLCMKEIKKITACAPVRVGDIIIDNIANTGVAVIATRDVEAQK